MIGYATLDPDTYALLGVEDYDALVVDFIPEIFISIDAAQVHCLGAIAGDIHSLGSANGSVHALGAVAGEVNQ